MAIAEGKENVAPFRSSDPLHRKASSPGTKISKQGRSKSIGPGDLPSLDGPKQDARNRRKSTYVPATKSIISSDVEKAERQAARRRTLANRRVSFAPEATLHTWDVIEFMRDRTTSTDSSDHTRRASNVTNSSRDRSPSEHSPTQSSDIEEPPSTPSEQEDGPDDTASSPAPQREMHKKQRRRESDIPPMDFNNPDDAYSSSGISGSSDMSGSDDEEESEEGDDSDATGTAMSLDMGEETVRSSESASSTSSSARLEAALNQAAEMAGTRGIEYDEHGDDVSMEMVGEETTNAFKPWVHSAALDQENVNPFSPAFKAQIASSVVDQSQTEEEEETGDVSMEVTRAVGGILRGRTREAASSPTGDATMEMTRALGGVQDNGQGSPTALSGQKRRRSTTESGSPGESVSAVRSKRRRSSVARSSIGDDTMDLTIAIGGIQTADSPVKLERRKSVVRRRSSGVVFEKNDATMDMTQAFGGVKNFTRNDHTSFSFDENEELTMELTTVLGDIKAAKNVVARPVTPVTSQSPPRSAVNTTPREQERFVDAPDLGPRKLLTPIFQKQVILSAEKKSSSKKSRESMSPTGDTAGSDVDAQGVATAVQEQAERTSDAHRSETPEFSPLKDAVVYPTLPSAETRASLAQSTPPQSPVKSGESTPKIGAEQQLDQMPESQLSPLVEKQQRSSPSKAVTPPEKARDLQEARSIVNSIKLMSTPRKETLKTVTPKKHTPVKPLSPVKIATPRIRATPKSRTIAKRSPARQFSEDLLNVPLTNKSARKIHLQQFLDAAGIRFMDLIATRRRLTTAPTPSKARRSESIANEEPDRITLETATVAAACTQPEHDMYQHACHELKHYISEGKKIIKQLEAETYRDQPPLLQAYMHASGDRKALLDAHMREMKTQARYRSKEIWYAWRSQLLEDLMKALASIGEGLIADDDTLQHAEEIVEQVLPGLVQEQRELQQEAERFEQAFSAMSEEEREELAAAREGIVVADAELMEKRRVLEELRQEAREQETLADDLQDTKSEFTAAIREADRVREACRGISVDEITQLKGKTIPHLTMLNSQLTRRSLHQRPRRNPPLVHHLRHLLADHHHPDLQTPTPALLPPIRLQPYNHHFPTIPQPPHQPDLHPHQQQRTHHHPPLLPPTPPRPVSYTHLTLPTKRIV